MVVSKDTQNAIKEAIDELRMEYFSRIEQVEEVNERLNLEVIELKKKLIETLLNYLKNNKPLFSSPIKKKSEGAPHISESETLVINAISAEQKEKVKISYFYYF